MVNAGRNLKSEMKLTPQQRVPFYLTGAPGAATLAALEALVRPSQLHRVDELPRADSPVAVVGVWRSAAAYTGPQHWASLARAASVLWGGLMVLT